MKDYLKKAFKTDRTKDECRDTGMAIVLILLIAAAVLRQNVYVGAAIVVHIVNMIFPQIYRPAAILWLGFSHCLGSVVSRILLTVIFLLVVVPTSILRRMMGKDTLKLKAFSSGASVLRERVHTFTAADIEKPY